MDLVVKEWSFPMAVIGYEFTINFVFGDYFFITEFLKNSLVKIWCDQKNIAIFALLKKLKNAIHVPTYKNCESV